MIDVRQTWLHHLQNWYRNGKRLQSFERSENIRSLIADSIRVLTLLHTLEGPHHSLNLVTEDGERFVLEKGDCFLVVQFTDDLRDMARGCLQRQRAGRCELRGQRHADFLRRVLPAKLYAAAIQEQLADYEFEFQEHLNAGDGKAADKCYRHYFRRAIPEAIARELLRSLSARLKFFAGR